MPEIAADLQFNQWYHLALTYSECTWMESWRTRPWESAHAAVALRPDRHGGLRLEELSLAPPEQVVPF